MMKALITVCALTLATTMPLLASEHSMSEVARPDVSTIAHSGGCRKSSPPGQCCHAGSQPLHCH
ncbi:hypothetical protein FGD77_18930 [Roseovarius sp. M141]|nr:hypothetical protein [Roseovarius sp. M141]